MIRSILVILTYVVGFTRVKTEDFYNILVCLSPSGTANIVALGIGECISSIVCQNKYGFNKKAETVISRLFFRYAEKLIVLWMASGKKIEVVIAFPQQDLFYF